MFKSGRSIVAIVAITGLATGTLMLSSLPLAADTEMAMPGSATEHAAEAAQYDQEAADLAKKAERHAALARSYRARGNSTNKQSASYRSLANHCDRLAKAYRAAADEARDMAKSHRSMGAAG